MGLVKKKGVVMVQEAMNPHVPVIVGMNVLTELDRQMSQDGLCIGKSWLL